jgi:hypothetical protein
MTQKYGLQCSACGDVIAVEKEGEAEYCNCGKTNIYKGPVLEEVNWENGIEPPLRILLGDKTKQEVKH